MTPTFKPPETIQTLRPLSLIGGHFGSGKTEFAIALAGLIRHHLDVALTLTDLDIVNPYFRASQYAAPAPNFEVVAPSVNAYAIPPALRHSAAAGRNHFHIYDLGGDPVGARAIAPIHREIAAQSHHFYWLLNPNRPETATPDRALHYANEIEKSARLPFTAIVLNAHLAEFTTAQTILDAQKFAKSVSASKNIPIAFQLVEDRLCSKLETGNLPRLRFRRALRKPWE